MKLILFVLRSVLVWTWIFAGLIIELLVFPLLSRASRRNVVCHWSRGLMFLSGVKIQVVGKSVNDQAIMWVANHISWVDIFVLNSVRTTSFIAKSDIRKWPIIGLLVAWAGTLFIDRRQRYAIREAAKQIKHCFDYGDAVGLFPEGTTTDGMQVLPFHAGLLDAAIQAKVPVQPVALKFMRGAQRAPELAFIGDQTLIANLWHLLGSWGVRVECEFLEPIDTSDLNRAEVASKAHQMISKSIVIN